MNANNKEDAAKLLAESHYAIEPGIKHVFKIVASAGNESDPKEPIKLLEVNESSTAVGIQPVFFGPHAASGMCFPSVIVEVTPDEYNKIVCNPPILPLPNGWRLGDEYAKPKTAGCQ
jgi:hypothetical protein